MSEQFRDQGEIKEGDLKVWWVPQVPMKAFEYPVPSVEVGKHLVEALTRYDLFQFENRVKPDYCNAGGILVYENGDWFDLEENDE